MKIAFLVDSFPNISETFILNQITGLIELGNEVTIFSACRPETMEFHNEIKQYGLLNLTYYHNDKPSNKLIRVLEAIWLFLTRVWKNPFVLLNSLNVFKYRRDAFSLSLFYKAILFSSIGEFDILFCHFGPNGELAATLKELGIKGKIVTMFHGYDIRKGIAQGPQIYSKLMSQGDLFLSISQYNFKHLINFGFDPKKIVSHPVGINIDRYPIKDITAKESSSETVLILSVSRFIEEKGLEYGIRAINILVTERGFSNIRYQIIGDGPLLTDMKKLVLELNLSRNVHFYGYQQNDGVVKALKKADIFLLPSIAEALPVAIMEAQATGLPVVATDVGSVSQVVIDKETGFIVEPGNPAALADKIEFLLKNPDSWRIMGERGRQHIKSKYDVKNLNSSLQNLFEKLIN